MYPQHAYYAPPQGPSQMHALASAATHVDYKQKLTDAYAAMTPVIVEFEGKLATLSSRVDALFEQRGGAKTGTFISNAEAILAETVAIEKGIEECIAFVEPQLSAVHQRIIHLQHLQDTQRNYNKCITDRLGEIERIMNMPMPSIQPAPSAAPPPAQAAATAAASVPIPPPAPKEDKKARVDGVVEADRSRILVVNTMDEWLWTCLYAKAMKLPFTLFPGSVPACGMARIMGEDGKTRHDSVVITNDDKIVRVTYIHPEEWQAKSGEPIVLHSPTKGLPPFADHVHSSFYAWLNGQNKALMRVQKNPPGWIARRVPGTQPLLVFRMEEA
jgi:hypothetical protein